MPTVYVNGRAREFQDKVTLKEILDSLNMQPEMVNIQVNQELIDREKFSKTVVTEKDSVEILMYMGGG